jgi:hypothetical protein
MSVTAILNLAQVDERLRKVLGEQVKRSNLIKAGVARELLASQNLDQLLADLEVALRVSYLEWQQQSRSDKTVDLTH